MVLIDHDGSSTISGHSGSIALNATSPTSIQVSHSNEPLATPEVDFTPKVTPVTTGNKTTVTKDSIRELASEYVPIHGNTGDLWA